MHIKNLITISILLFSTGFIYSCGKKAEAPTNEQLIQEQYQESLKARWIELSPHDEAILQKCIEQDSDEGATIPDLRYQEEEADALKEKNLLTWSSNTQKYKATQLGKDVYGYGQKLKEEEMKKDAKYRSKRVLK